MTPAGEFGAARIAIRLPGNEEEEDQYKLRLFVSTDPRRLPLRMTAEPGWGSVRMELVSYRGSSSCLLGCHVDPMILVARSKILFGKNLSASMKAI